MMTPTTIPDLISVDNNMNNMDLSLEKTIQKKLIDPSNNLTLQTISDVKVLIQFGNLVEHLAIPVIKEIESILTNDTFCLSHIPLIILIVTNLYKEIPSSFSVHNFLLDLSNKNNLFMLITFFVDCIIESNLVNTSVVNKKALEKTVNLSIELLKTNIENVQKTCFPSNHHCMFRFFCGCCQKKQKAT